MVLEELQGKTGPTSRPSLRRCMLIIAGLMLVYPAPLFDYIGFALVVAVVVIQKIRGPTVSAAT